MVQTFLINLTTKVVIGQRDDYMDACLLRCPYFK